MIKRRKVHGREIATICVLVFLGVFSICNAKLVKEPLKQFVKGDAGFTEFTKEIRDAYTSERLSMKNPFICINGLFSRLIGQRVCNEVVLLENDMLSLTVKRYNMKKQAAAITELDKHLKKQKIPFLYVQAPYKEEPEDILYPVGVTSYANENADELLGRLKDEQVEFLDLRPYLSANVDLINKYYFKTDHHWNFTGAFVGFGKIAEKVAVMFPEKEIDLTYTKWEQWESHTLEKWFLGSRGKRVGMLFAGVDDITWYTPKFETNMYRSVPKYNAVFEGDFVKTNIREKYIEKKDYFKDNPYCLYIGGDYPIVHHKNYLPVTDMKLLIVKDSYTSPVQAYLSTMFTEIDVIDPRHFKETGVAEYVKESQPDLVILMMNPSVFGVSDYMDFGVNKQEK